ncbi:MAG: polysaccharide biosynthesis tyrosine autokinase [Burkholderiaceae bacterium]
MFEPAGQPEARSSMIPLGQAAPIVMNFWRTVRRFKWLILSCGLFAALLGFIVAKLITPNYVATATLLVQGDRPAALTFEQRVLGPGDERDRNRTQAQLAGSRDVALRVIERLELARQPQFRDALEATGPQADRDVQLDATTAALLKIYFENLSIETVRDTQLMRIGFNSSDPVLAARIANQVAESYIDVEMAMRLEAIQAANTLISNKLRELRLKLDDSQARLLVTEGRQSMSDEQAGQRGSALAQVAALNEQLVRARVERTRLEQMVKAGPEALARQSASIQTDDGVVRAREALSLAQTRLAQAANTYGQSHPSYRAAAVEVQTAQARLARAEDTARNGLVAQVELARLNETSLELALDEARSNLQETNTRGAGLTQLRQEVEVNRQIYQAFLTRMRETSAAANVQSPIARIVERAVAPERPDSPRTLLIASACLLIGLLGGLAYALLRTAADRTLRTQGDAEALLGVPALAAVPEFSPELRLLRGHLVHSNPSEFFSEALRSAAAQILTSLPRRGPCQTIAITSATFEEGKSTIACNLALELARSRRVLLIDGDVHRRRAAALLGISPRAEGLVQWLDTDPGTLPRIHEVADSTLQVLSAGHVSSHGAAHCHFGRFEDRLAVLADKYDLIIVDTPAIEAVSDGLLIAGACSAFVLVVRSGETPVAVARRSMNRLRAVNRGALGVIINRHDFDSAERDFGEPSAFSGYRHYVPRTQNPAV